MSKPLPIGARVRSFDFPSRRDCYIDGVILGYGGIGAAAGLFPADSCYRIKAVSRVWEGIAGPAADEDYYPPFDGIFGPLVELLP